MRYPSYPRRPRRGDVLETRYGLATVTATTRTGEDIVVRDAHGQERELTRAPTGCWYRPVPAAGREPSPQGS